MPGSTILKNIFIKIIYNTPVPKITFKHRSMPTEPMANSPFLLKNRELAQIPSAMYFVMDRKYTIKQFNSELAKFIGLDREQTHSFLKFLSLQSTQEFQKTVNKILFSRQNSFCAVDVLGKSGRLKHIRLEGFLLKNGDIHFNVIDMTETKNLSVKVNQLEESLNIMNRLLEQTTAPISSLDQNFNITHLNPSFFELFEQVFNVKVTVGSNLMDVFLKRPDLNAKLIKIFQNVKTLEKTSILFDWSNESDGRLYQCEMSIKAVLDKITQSPLYMVHVKVLNENKPEILIKDEKTNTKIHSEFLHEVNQPLTAIVAYSMSCFFIVESNILYKEKLAKISNYVEQIALQTEYLGKVMYSMINFRKNENLCVECININELIQESLAILTYNLLNVKLKISLDLKDGISHVFANKIHIMQVILNLVRNSIEALKNVEDVEPELIIKTTEAENNITVHVLDNGSGISSDFGNNLFQSNYTSKPKEKGLGISICSDLIAHYGGILRFHDHPSRGAWVTFTLPKQELVDELPE